MVKLCGQSPLVQGVVIIRMHSDHKHCANFYTLVNVFFKILNITMQFKYTRYNIVLLAYNEIAII